MAFYGTRRPKSLTSFKPQWLETTLGGLVEWDKSQVGMDVSDLTHLQAKEPDPSKIEGRMADQSASPRTTTSGMKIKSEKCA